MASRIVNTVRECILSSDSTKECWDEEDEGQAWIENEVLLFNDLYKEIVNKESPDIFNDCEKTVQGAIKFLEKQNKQYLTLLDTFITKGGSSNKMPFILRDEEGKNKKHYILN